MSHTTAENNKPPEGEEPEEPFPMTGDWPEDAIDEDNGRYQNTCGLCGRQFIGHKRRVACKVCATKPKPTTGEWTVESIRSLMDFQIPVPTSLAWCLQKVAEAHNAALSDKEKECADVMDKHEQELAKALAAERELRRKEFQGFTLGKAYNELEQQLAAERTCIDEVQRNRDEILLSLEEARKLLFAVHPFVEAWAMFDLADDIKDYLDGRKSTVQGHDQEPAGGSVTSEPEGGKEGATGRKKVDPGAEGSQVQTDAGQQAPPAST